jgi:dolichyl-diphosphooligosaccharide--protein glycosyltransferase
MPLTNTSLRNYPQYLYYNGAEKFFTWFDYMVWYPLGRPVGSTIYPGMQFTAVWLKNHVFTTWSLNDVCCYMPTWFGAIASAIVGMMTYECSIPQNSNTNILRVVMDLVQGKITNPPFTQQPVIFGLYSPAVEAGVFAMAMMAIVPAHLMRSVGGGYDNESVAMTAMTSTFYCWVRSLRNGDHYSFVYAILAGIAYFYMVAAWGGYIFVLNMVGVHAALLVIMGRFSTKVYLSYTLFYAIGTALAIQVPVVGWAPLKSLEQLGPCAVFCGYQGLQFSEVIKRRRNLSRKEAWKLRFQVFGAGLMVLIVLASVVAPSGYFGPISSRVRGLFVQHTKTGNPLVDSVAEHQPASSRAYFQYLHHVCVFAPMGYLMVLLNLSDSSSFLLAWGTAAYFFSHKMVRLILLTAPIGTAFAGIAVGRIFAWCIHQFWGDGMSEEDESVPTATPADDANESKKDGKKKKIPKKPIQKSTGSSFDGFIALKNGFETASKSSEGIIVKRIVACVTLFLFYLVGKSFTTYCFRLANDLSNPTIIVKARTRDGREVILDDYREAYFWLRDNTPEDARIMAWWDYGYQITAIANRTTIADGNTWNHEHIALLGKALTTDVEEGYQIARHLADYVLVWAGGGGDDLAKSPHLARIANSVYRDHCPGDPTCRAFGFLVSTAELWELVPAFLKLLTLMLSLFSNDLHVRIAKVLLRK